MDGLVVTLRRLPEGRLRVEVEGIRATATVVGDDLQLVVALDRASLADSSQCRTASGASRDLLAVCTAPSPTARYAQPSSQREAMPRDRAQFRPRHAGQEAQLVRASQAIDGGRSDPRADSDRLAAGGGGKDQSAAKKNASPKTATAPRTTPSPRAPHTTPSPTGAPAGCLDVPTTVLQMIASGEEQGVGGLRLSNGRAVRSPDFKKVFFVAADVTAPGVSGYSGVWSVNDLQSPGLILAVDGFAKQFTVWPDADKTDARISGADPSVNRAKDCLR